MGLIDKLKGIASNGTANLVEKLGDAFDKNFTNQEESQKALNEASKIISDHNEKTFELQNKELELELNDKDSARDREVELAKTGVKDKTPSILAYIAVLGFFSTVILLFFIDLNALKSEQALLLGGLLGTLGSNSNSVYQYYFGSSTGSKAKQEQLDKMAKK